ncbi:hypothetical protein ACFOOP_14205 [Marinicaulis aureus]|uniref:Uncharacterized protein n=1 Tax=Hyphococcus aureus TaxID=2666033 RepID=A0ABW1KYJ3_9PROT
MDSRVGQTNLTIKFGSTDYEPANEAAAKLKEARKQIAQRYSELVAAENILKEDATVSEPMRLVKLSKLAENRSQWVYDRLHEARSIAHKQLALHQSKIETLYQMPSSQNLEMRHRDMRQYLTRMPLNKRIEFVRDALLRKDEVILSAIVTAPRELSEVLPLHYGEAKVALAQIKAPADFNAINIIQEELETLDDAERNFDSAVMDEFVTPGADLEKNQELSNRLLADI